MWKKKFKYTEDKPKKKKASRFQSINAIPLDEQINEEKKVEETDFPDKEKENDIDPMSDLPLVKKMHKGEDEEFCDDEAGSVNRKSKKKLKQSSCDNNHRIVKSHLEGVDISIEYLD